MNFEIGEDMGIRAVFEAYRNQMKMDFDGDGKNEILACISVNEKKGAVEFVEGKYYYFPDEEWVSRQNRDINHILIDVNGKVKMLIKTMSLSRMSSHLSFEIDSLYIKMSKSGCAFWTIVASVIRPFDGVRMNLS